MYAQLITPNPHIPCKPGWCLQYVRQAFDLPARYGSATEAWLASESKHRDRNFPEGVWTAVWYGLDSNVHGHVVLLAPDGSCYSTSSLRNTPYHHPNLAHLEAYYAHYGMTLTYRGWTEDVAGFPVIAPAAVSAQGEINQSEEDDMAWSFEDKQFLQNELERRKLAIVAEVKVDLAERFHDLKLFVQSDSENREVVTRASLDERVNELQADLEKKLAELDVA